MAEDLLLEIGVEELPASFVNEALRALPELTRARLRELRLEHGPISTCGTPRRLAIIAQRVSRAQPDLDEQVLGPPARVAFDAEGHPTQAAVAFASKIGVAVPSLERVETPKGSYLSGHRRQRGAEAMALLPEALASICREIPFRKSMRWSDRDETFGRPVRWLVALFGERVIEFEFAGVRAHRLSYGHRFLAKEPIAIESPSAYLSVLREHHVIADVEERKALMIERLHAAARAANGSLILDDFLVEENASLVEEPQVLVGSFEARFLALPEHVILNVAKGHQRYFGVRAPSGELLPNYLAVVGTLNNEENVRRGNDRVMRARLADAKFFYDEDLKVPLRERRKSLHGIIFHKRLGSVGDKVDRMLELVPALGRELAMSEDVISRACAGTELAKCDLVTLMVGELPELQGEMGAAYALAQGVDPQVARVIKEHYQPRGAEDEIPESDAGALVALADRLDTLTGCFAIGLLPTGAADPLALRRAAIGVLRIALHKEWDLAIGRTVEAAYRTFSKVKLDLDEAETEKKLHGFLRQRLRGILSEELAADVVDACLAASADRPLDVALRARALNAIAAEARASVGEVLKRATNIAKEAPDGAPEPPERVLVEVHPSERQLFAALEGLRGRLAAAQRERDYAGALNAISAFAPVLGQFFTDVFVMVDDARVRDNRLRLMREIQRTCSTLANFNLLAKRGEA